MISGRCPKFRRRSNQNPRCWPDAVARRAWWVALGALRERQVLPRLGGVGAPQSLGVRGASGRYGARDGGKPDAAAAERRGEWQRSQHGTHVEGDAAQRDAAGSFRCGILLCWAGGRQAETGGVPARRCSSYQECEPGMSFVVVGRDEFGAPFASGNFESR